MLLQAARDWNIDLSRSYMIGDSERDTLAGEHAGCLRSVRIKTNEPGALLRAVDEILRQS